MARIYRITLEPIDLRRIVEGALTITLERGKGDRFLPSRYSLEPHDLFWVAESYQTVGIGPNDDAGGSYMIDGKLWHIVAPRSPVLWKPPLMTSTGKIRWRPNYSMPEELSRFTLEVLEVRHGKKTVVSCGVHRRNVREIARETEHLERRHGAKKRTA